MSFVKDKAEIIEMLKEAGGSECVFSLVAEFQSFEGKLQTATRQLGGYTCIDGEIGLLFAAQHEMLT